jgi:hypothetical protein
MLLPHLFRPRAALVAMVLALPAACRSSTEPERMTRLVVGRLATPASAALQAPDTVLVGARFTATVVTHGTPCETPAGGEVRVTGLVATITPYDMRYDSTCELILVAHPRAVPLRFDVPGTAVVRTAGAGGVTAERTVVVRPLR